jgi:hypothetical protein
MRKRDRQVEYLSYSDLAKAAHSNASAHAAFERYNQLKAAGVADPKITYSRANGYQVRDPHTIDPNALWRPSN